MHEGVNGTGALAGERRGGGAGSLEARPHLMSSSFLFDFLDSSSLNFFKIDSCMDGEGIIFLLIFGYCCGRWVQMVNESFFLVNCYGHGRKKQLDLIL
jgi:hypothetical protein